MPPFPYVNVKEQFFGTLGAIETNRKYYKWYKPPRGRDMATFGGDHDTIVKSMREITGDAVEAFFGNIVSEKPLEMTASSVDSTLATLLGRMAMELRREVTWDKLLRLV